MPTVGFNTEEHTGVLSVLSMVCCWEHAAGFLWLVAMRSFRSMALTFLR